MDSEKLIGDLFLLLCKCLTTACLHIAEELLWSLSLFLGRKCGLVSQTLNWLCKGKNCFCCRAVYSWTVKAVHKNVPIYEE